MTAAKSNAPELPILLFRSPDEWDEWLHRHGADSPGVWLRLAKKNAGLASITYAEAVEVGLCHGWIDSQKKGFDERSSLQRFTRRGRKSIWSRINREKAEALVKAGRMRPAGMAAIEAAREDGRWEAAYDSQRTSTVPDDLRRALDESPAARDFFATLDRANRYAILFRVQTATRPETRAKRIATFVAMLERGEKIHG